MDRYIVALFSNFDGSMLMEEVLATSQVEAGMKILQDEEWDMSDLEIKTYDQLQEFAFNCDHGIGVIKISDSRAGRSGGGLQTHTAQLDSVASFH